jgi:glycosyltransferase involved in cell wall biosynthesis
MISVLILTHNEEQDLPAALESVAWCDDVHVFDSHSSDSTVEVARRYGAHVAQRPFDNYATQRNAALDTLPFKNPWIFVLDADECVPPALAAELQQVPQTAPPHVAAYRVRRQDYLFDTWLKHAQMSPWYVRLLRHGKARYWRVVNEVLQVDGETATLENPLEHFPFSKGIEHWIAKHNRYSSLEAFHILEQADALKPSLAKALRANDFHERRLHQKAIFYRMPGRPWIKFGYLYLIRGGFLDGYAGYTYARLQSLYEYLIVVKTRELQRRRFKNS